VNVAGAALPNGAVAGSPLFWRTLTLCGLIAVLDGYDTQAIAFVAPALGSEWGGEKDLFGIVFAAGLFGLLAGSLFFGPFADRYGRRPTLCLATLLFGGFALATPLAGSIETLTLLRFLTGIGLGAAVPNLIALTSEHAPPHRRALAVSAMFCGFPLGALGGGLVAAALIEPFGWKSVFIIGGVLPLLLLPVLLRWLPESPDWGRRREGPQAPVRQLFATGLAAVTPLLWTTFFASLLVMYFLVNWLPMIFVAAGEPLDRAIRSTILLNIGGIVGALLIARAIDRFGAIRVLVPAYLFAAICVLSVGRVAPGSAAMATAVFLAGFGIVGGQIGCNALAASIYPTSIRAPAWAGRSASAAWAPWSDRSSALGCSPPVPGTGLFSVPRRPSQQWWPPLWSGWHRF